MNLKDISAAALKLSRDDQLRLVTSVNGNLRMVALCSFSPGTKVRFNTRSGVSIEGKVVRVNNKNVKVESRYDRYGTDVGHTVTWTVSPQLLTNA